MNAIRDLCEKIRRVETMPEIDWREIDAALVELSALQAIAKAALKYWNSTQEIGHTLEQLEKAKKANDDDTRPDTSV